MDANRQQIIDLETRFWQSMKDKDVPTAQAMVAEESMATGPHGTMRMDPSKFARLMREAPWTLDRFEMSDVDVIFPTNDVAVITYKVHEIGEMDGKPMDMVAADSTVWARDGDNWKCALHTETVLSPNLPRRRASAPVAPGPAFLHQGSRAHHPPEDRAPTA